MSNEEAVKQALGEAVSSIYFADNSDYLSSLWTIVSLLGGEEAVKLLEENEAQAYIKYSCPHAKQDNANSPPA